jgi:hypothetical protein
MNVTIEIKMILLALDSLSIATSAPKNLYGVQP